MPYKTNTDLPENLKNVLPEHAQELYLEAFNSAWDQYDEPEERASTSSAGETLIPGELHNSDVNEQYGLTVPDEYYTTIGGYVFGALGRLPVVGDRVSGGGATFFVREMDGRRIAMLAMEKGEQ